MQGEEVSHVVREQDSSVRRGVLQLHSVGRTCVPGVDGVGDIHSSGNKRPDEGPVDGPVDGVLIEVQRERHAQLCASESNALADRLPEKPVRDRIFRAIELAQLRRVVYAGR